ncbi:hypothetical protein BGZ61DRAFT_461315 [Ilyonectria robusta]|uniref:uncharacterized protein n=1 Tax=Ilyonectria robusta TaxID=1079257 RepID=UPI001E8DDD20|nr:uncharacterized protein BGZ61DRAFT_461315 [Ilyonectria robusta]KAH8667159.1 hypothetical protein BGZ61DRAFT_461315 [Ilyonectria robusta]
MASITIANLPTEILTQIFGNFCLHCCGEHDQPCDIGHLRDPLAQERGQMRRSRSWYYKHYRLPLCELSFVSRRFRGIAQSVLHHEFVLGIGDSWQASGFQWDSRLVLFMRTMRRRPDLANLVKVVSVHRLLFQSIRQHHASTALDQCASASGIPLPAAWRRRAARIAALPLDDRPQLPVDEFAEYADSIMLHRQSMPTVGAMSWLAQEFTPYHERKENSVDGEMLAMLLSQLPNLEHLITQDPERDMSPLPNGALKALNVSHLPLKTLDVDILPGPIIEMASGLETLNLRNVAFVGTAVPSMPNLKALRMYDLSMSDYDLRVLLSACSGGLRTFVYDAPQYEEGEEHFRLCPAVKHLYRHRDTLERLNIDLRANHNPISHVDDFSLTDFTALKHLLLSTNAIIIPFSQRKNTDFLANRLPSSIVSLSFPNVQCDTKLSISKGLFGLCERMRLQPSQFPKLRQVICDGLARYPDNLLENMFEAVDVVFRYERWEVARHLCRPQQFVGESTVPIHIRFN